jgi:hypothetical protein
MMVTFYFLSWFMCQYSECKAQPLPPVSSFATRSQCESAGRNLAEGEAGYSEGARFACSEAKRWVQQEIKFENFDFRDIGPKGSGRISISGGTACTLNKKCARNDNQACFKSGVAQCIPPFATTR